MSVIIHSMMEYGELISFKSRVVGKDLSEEVTLNWDLNDKVPTVQRSWERVAQKRLWDMDNLFWE